MSCNIKLVNDLLHVPEPLTDEKGFVVWKDCLKLSIQAHGLYRHLDGTSTKPATPPTTLDGHTHTLMPEVGLNEKFSKDLSLYLPNQAIIFQQIASMIPYCI